MRLVTCHQRSEVEWADFDGTGGGEDPGEGRNSAGCGGRMMRSWASADSFALLKIYGGLAQPPGAGAAAGGGGRLRASRPRHHLTTAPVRRARQRKITSWISPRVTGVGRMMAGASCVENGRLSAASRPQRR